MENVKMMDIVYVIYLRESIYLLNNVVDDRFDISRLELF